MRSLIRSLALAALAIVGLLARSAAADGPAPVTTVLLVRHAEKDTTRIGADPPLSLAGRLRAEALARVLGDARVSTIFVTPWLRNRQTAEPLARQLGDTLTVIDPIDETVRRVLEHRGETVLVVGHGNTIPKILATLVGEAALDSIAVHFDDLFVVTLAPGLPPRWLKLHYGPASP